MLSFNEKLVELELHLKEINKQYAIEFLENINIPINQVKGYYKLNTNKVVKKSYTPFLIEEIVNNKAIFLLKSLEYDFKLSFPIPKYLSIGVGYDFIAIITLDNKCQLFFVYCDEVCTTSIEKTALINMLHLLCFPLKIKVL